MRIKLIIICILINIQNVIGQVVMPLSNGFDGSLEAVNYHDKQIDAISSVNNEFILNTFNGINWDNRNISDIIGLKSETNINRKVNSIIKINNEFAIHITDIGISTKERIFLINDNSSKEITSTFLTNAKIIKLLNYNNQLVIGGQFSSTFDNFNMLIYDGNQLKGLGTNITSSPTHTINDFLAINNRIYASGTFSGEGIFDGSQLVYYENNKWNNISNLPFVNGIKDLGAINNQLIVMGVDFDGKYKFAKYELSEWSLMADSISNFKINHINSFNFDGQRIWLSGDFVYKNKDNVNLIFWDKIYWKPLFTNIENSQLFIGNGKSNHIITSSFQKPNNHAGYLTFGLSAIYGKVVLDDNKNCISDIGEKGLPFVNFKVKQIDPTFTSDNKGNYLLILDSSLKSIQVEFVTPQYHSFYCPPMRDLQVNKAGLYELTDVVFYQQASKYDAILKIHDYSGWKLSKVSKNKQEICVYNVGTEAISNSMLNLLKSVELEYSDFSLLPITQSEYHYQFKVPTILKGEKYCINFLTNLDANTKVGTQLKTKAFFNIEGHEDEKATNNGDTLIQTVTNQPLIQGKYVKQAFFISDKIDFIDYKIVYKNTSRNPKNKITITDTLDKNLLIGQQGTITQCSHDVTIIPTYFMENNKYRYKYVFEINNANLKDSATDELASIGYLDFGLHLNNSTPLAIGTIIKNKAEVWFDKLEPKNTNAVFNRVSDNVSIDKYKIVSNYKIYPNPAKHILIIENPYRHDLDVKIIDIAGKPLYQYQFISKDKSVLVDTDKLEFGVYFIQINDTIQKLIITN